MFISITSDDAKRIFAAELAGIFMESGGKGTDDTHTICVYGKHRDAVCIAYFESKRDCEDAMEHVLNAISTGVLYTEISANRIQAG